MSADTNAMQIAVLSNLIENIPGGGSIDPAMLSDIMAAIEENSNKIDMNSDDITMATMTAAMLSDQSASMMMSVDMNSDKIDANMMAISTNTDGVSTNMMSIGANSDAISTQMDAISTNTDKSTMNEMINAMQDSAI